MYNISSQLASQTISKITVWNCLVLLGKVSGNLTQFTSDRMTVEGWAVGVRVVIKRAYKGIEVFKGLSTIISPLKIAKQILERTEFKSRDLTVTRRSERLFLVDSFQDPSVKHVVNAQPDGLTCSCMKFKCLKNRMEKEAPQLLKAIGQISSPDRSKVCVTEIYDHYTRIIEEKIHIQCHHIRAVMRQAFNAFSSLEYSMNWKQVIKRYKPGQDDWINNERWSEELDMLPELGKFNPKTR
ncbi:hypothetical protein [Nodularia sphaerocarpa]|uniref:hypothetical protein n=1 Tax=Nodularia sphaerocarpa TaxID=137816 RepID=UPI00232F649C|nr:hypothetical protein [Nodularia sphaerocarpa]MDB9373268.1 hypothetical protein [Nodularia sphaerocarpa CS-585]MDB9378423.1 hypothetical protein [Nodularia sphaerocarpa CS-585A2]